MTSLGDLLVLHYQEVLRTLADEEVKKAEAVRRYMKNPRPRGGGDNQNGKSIHRRPRRPRQRCG